MLRPRSRGGVRLYDADPRSAPQFDPQFLADPDDMATMLKGARKMREILRCTAFERYRHQAATRTRRRS